MTLRKSFDLWPGSSLYMVLGPNKLASEDLPNLKLLLLSKGSMVDLGLAQVLECFFTSIQILIDLPLCARPGGGLAKHCIGRSHRQGVGGGISVLFCRFCIL